jgi:mediator of RNA polymerase II transcription subunit 22
MSDLPQSDVSRPSKLPTANLLLQGQAPPAIDQTSAEYLDAVEEEWNKKVDVEIETLADGMVDLVNLASVRSYGIAHCSS